MDVKGRVRHCVRVEFYFPGVFLVQGVEDAGVLQGKIVALVHGLRTGHAVGSWSTGSSGFHGGICLGAVRVFGRSGGFVEEGYRGFEWSSTVFDLLHFLTIYLKINENC